MIIIYSDYLGRTSNQRGVFQKEKYQVLNFFFFKPLKICIYMLTEAKVTLAVVEKILQKSAFVNRETIFATFEMQCNK